MKPKMINQQLTARMHESEKDNVGIIMDDLRAKGWTFFVTETLCGRTNYRNRTCTVPVWAFNADNKAANGDTEYWLYYLSHEIAHAIRFENYCDRHGRRNALRGYGWRGNDHGANFMAIFKQVCPTHLQHHELGYKPRNAAAAGIRGKK